MSYFVQTSTFVSENVKSLYLIHLNIVVHCSLCWSCTLGHSYLLFKNLETCRNNWQMDIPIIVRYCLLYTTESAGFAKPAGLQ